MYRLYLVDADGNTAVSSDEYYYEEDALEAAASCTDGEGSMNGVPIVEATVIED